jgi:ribosome-binding factor A
MSSVALPSQRQLRVAEQIRHVLVETLQRGKFHHMELLDAASTVTVSEVKISPDLKNATAYIIRMGGASLEDLLAALNDSHSYFQKELAKKLQMRFTPRLRFVSDDSFEKAARIDEILYNLPHTQTDKRKSALTQFDDEEDEN